MESFHENTSEDLEWFLNHVRSRIEAYAERNGLVLACGPAPFLKAVQGFALAAKARCQLSLEDVYKRQGKAEGGFSCGAQTGISRPQRF